LSRLPKREIRAAKVRNLLETLGTVIMAMAKPEITTALKNQVANAKYRYKLRGIPMI